ncbi:MAG TPA: hypothetical protein VH815_16425, partial [Acidobacteriota bacterium]
MKLPLVFIFLFASIFAQSSSAAAADEIFQFGDFALYVPANVSSVRGIFLSLGGPDTRAFVTDGNFGAPSPKLEASLHILGQELRTIAAEKRLAILGVSRAAIESSSKSDKFILNAITEAAKKSNHSELESAALFIYGISGGTPEAAGFAVRNPDRVGALLLKVPAIPERLNDVKAIQVP